MIILVAIVLLVFGEAETRTKVKPWTHKEVINDPSVVEWSDDFPTFARLVLRKEFHFNLKIYCGLTILIGSNTILAERVRVCSRFIGDTKDHATCSYVDAISGEKEIFIRNIYTMKVKFNKKDGEVVGIMKNVPIYYGLGSTSIYCEATPGAPDTGFVWRAKSELYIMDFRDFGIHGPLSPSVWNFAVSGKGHDVMKRTISLYNVIEYFPPRGMQEHFSTSAFTSNWMPILDMNFEVYICPDTNYVECRKNKSLEIFHLGWRTLGYQIWPVVFNKALKMFRGRMERKVLDFLKGRRAIVFFDGILNHINTKINEDNPQTITYPANSIESENEVLYNDSTVHFMHYAPNLLPQSYPTTYEFLYEGPAGKFNIKEGVHYKRLGFRHATFEESPGQPTLRFQGPYPVETNAAYRVIIHNKVQDCNATIGIIVVQYLKSTIEYTVYTVKPDVTVSCPAIKCNYELIIAAEILGRTTFVPPTHLEADSEKKMLGRLREVETEFYAHFQRRINISKEDDTTTHPQMTIAVMTFKGFHYFPGKPNRFTMSCVVHPHFIAEKIRRPKRGTYFARSAILVQALPPPTPLTLELESNPCIDICKLHCILEDKDIYLAAGVELRWTWDDNYTRTDAQERQVGEKYYFYTHGPLPTPTCILEFINPDFDEPFLKINATRSFENENITTINVD